MSPSTKRTVFILGFVAVVLIVLFVVSVTHTSGSNGCSKEQLDSWRGCVLNPEPVIQSQLTGCNAQLGKPFALTGSCVLTVAAAKSRSRGLTIQANDKPITLTFVTDADDKHLNQHTDLNPGDKPKEFSIGKDGQTFTLLCISGPCHATVQPAK